MLAIARDILLVWRGFYYVSAGTEMVDRIAITALWLTVMVRVKAFQVIGEDRTAVQGQDTILPCKLTGADLPTDTSENIIYQITWWKSTRENLEQHNFFTVNEYGKWRIVNGHTTSYRFNGSLQERDGSIVLPNVRLLDEGMYTCIFTLQKDYTAERTNMHLTVLVPPRLTISDHPVLAKEEVTLVSCEAANAKPSPKVTWDPGTLKGLVKEVTTETQNANGTSTVVSSLVGAPTMDIRNQTVQCVVTHPALETPRTLTMNIQLDYPPTSVMISKKQDRVFECVADAFPTANYTWRRDNKNSLPSDVKVTEGILDFTHQQPDGLNGVYICEASNSYGTSVGSIYVEFIITCPRHCVVCWVLPVLIVVGVGVAVAGLWWKKTRSQSPTPSGSPGVPSVQSQGLLRVCGSGQNPTPSEDVAVNAPLNEIVIQ